MRTKREFAAFVAPDGVWLVEYNCERDGYRIVAEWSDHSAAASIDATLDHLLTVIAHHSAGRARISIVLDQFGAFHHVMTLPEAPDEVLRPIVQREVQRVFGTPDAVVSFATGGQVERREPSRADGRTAPRHVVVAGAPRGTVDAIGAKLREKALDVRRVTVVADAMRKLYEAAGGPAEPTAMLICLGGGPHLAYFLDGRLEVSIDPPIVLQGERASVTMIMDQVERGNVYVRQQFRGAAVSRMLVAARAEEFSALSKALEDEFGVHVEPLLPGANSPEAVVAMGAALEPSGGAALDLFPHPPTFADRARMLARSSSGLAAATGAVAILVGIWTVTQFAQLVSVRGDVARREADLRASTSQVQSLRDVAERRADFVGEVSFIRASTDERASLASSLAAIGNALPAAARLDSLRVTRAADGWTGAMTGVVVGATTGEAVRSLDALFQLVRAQRGVMSATLDEFSYTAQHSGADAKSNPPLAVRDSAPADRDEPLAIHYRISLTLGSGRVH